MKQTQKRVLLFYVISFCQPKPGDQTLTAGFERTLQPVQMQSDNN